MNLTREVCRLLRERRDVTFEPIEIRLSGFDTRRSTVSLRQPFRSDFRVVVDSRDIARCFSTAGNAPCASNSLREYSAVLSGQEHDVNLGIYPGSFSLLPLYLRSYRDITWESLAYTGTRALSLGVLGG